jgi:hypothetical protein
MWAQSEHRFTVTKDPKRSSIQRRSVISNKSQIQTHPQHPATGTNCKAYGTAHKKFEDQLHIGPT